MKSDFYVVLAGRILQVATSILTLRLMTYRLGPDEMGKYALIVSITSFFALIFINPIGMYINRKLHSWHEHGVILSRFILGLQYLLFIVSFFVIIIIFVFYIFGFKWTISPVWLITLVGGSLIFNTINQTIIPSLNMLGKRVEWAVYSVITLWASLLLSMVLTRDLLKAEWWIVGQIGGLLFGSILGIFSFSKLLKNCISVKFQFRSWRMLKPIISFTVPVAIAVALNWVQFQSYRFVVNEMVGLKFLGLFITGYTLSSGIMGAFETTAMQYFFPIFYKKITNVDTVEQRKAWDEYAGIMFPLIFFTTIFIGCMSKPLLHFLVDKKYWNISQFVLYGAVVEMGRVMGNVYSMVAHATMKTKILIMPQFVGALSSIALVPLFIKFFPIQGIGIALIVASVLYVSAMHITMKKHLEVSINFKRVLTRMSLIIPIGLTWLGSLFWFKRSSIIDAGLLALAGLTYLAASYLIIRKNI